MDFFQAMSLMKSGAKVRVKSWPKDSYIGVTEETWKVFGKDKTKYTVISEDLTSISSCVSFSALVQADWQEFICDED